VDGGTPAVTVHLTEEEVQLQRLHSAHHEAAHAVVGAYFGWRVNYEGIEIEGIGEGRRDYTGQCCYIEDQTLEAVACVNCAGWLAEIRLTPDRAKRRSDDELLNEIAEVRCGEVWDAEDDSETFARILKDHFDATDEELIFQYRKYEKQTAALLEKEEIWGTIEELARMLLECGKLSEDEAHQVIRGEQGA
jgi:hypothetical protein